MLISELELRVNVIFSFQITICISGQYLLLDRPDYECSGTLYRSQLDCIRCSRLLANNWSGRGGCVWILPKLACSQCYRLQVCKVINLGISTQASFCVCKAAIQAWTPDQTNKKGFRAFGNEFRLVNNWSGCGISVWILPKLASSQYYRLQVCKLYKVGFLSKPPCWYAIQPFLPEL